MTGGWAATNTLRYAVLRANLADASQRTVQRSEQLAAERADALALVEAALDAAAATAEMHSTVGLHRAECACFEALAAALRAVREGK